MYLEEVFIGLLANTGHGMQSLGKLDYGRKVIYAVIMTHPSIFVKSEGLI